LFCHTEQQRVGDTGDGGTDQRCDPEQPPLGRCPVAVEECDAGGPWWISVSVSPIDRPANPLGARSSVEPRIASRKMKVSTTSVMSTASSEQPPATNPPITWVTQ
jgi:hypothetical protein